MKYIAPVYYRDFKCIASACKHSCCVGWEVDIDGDTLAFYESMRDSYGATIRGSIEKSDEPHFRLGEGERCPHLAKNGLCNIITECGEQSLCQICRDHPRYRNFYDGVVEIGLGLSCEEAARLALESDIGFLVSDSEDMAGAEYMTDYPTELFSGDDLWLAKEKSRLLAITQDKNVSIAKRISNLLPKSPSAEEIKALYLSLDILDNLWIKRIELLSANDFNRDLEKNSKLIERTISAFLFRHQTSESFYEPRTVAAFAVLSALIVAAIAKTPDNFADTLRAYSAEIEYSTENTERILDFL